MVPWRKNLSPCIVTGNGSCVPPVCACVCSSKNVCTCLCQFQRRKIDTFVFQCTFPWLNFWSLMSFLIPFYTYWSFTVFGDCSPFSLGCLILKLTHKRTLLGASGFHLPHFIWYVFFFLFMYTCFKDKHCKCYMIVLFLINEFFFIHIIKYFL